MIGHDHHHPHHHADDDREPIVFHQDPASQSLADALRWSFRLLSLIMVLVLGGFALSGFRTIEPQQVGIKKVFGRVTGVAGQGLAFTWPYPVGQIEIVNISEQSITIDDLWLYETPADLARPQDERTSPSEGLRPGMEGALFTGDRNLLHMRLVCNYKVQDALAYVSSIDEIDLREQTALRERLRMIVVNAAIESAASRTGESIRYAGKDAYREAVRSTAQDRLNASLMDPVRLDRLTALLRAAATRPEDQADANAVLALLNRGRLSEADARLTLLLERLAPEGRHDEMHMLMNELTVEPVRIVHIGVTPEWPQRARSAYDNAQRALAGLQQQRDQAIANAQNKLQNAAGANYRLLVGEPSLRPDAAPDANGRLDEVQKAYGLIGAYSVARDRGLDANGLLAKIDEVLISQATKGEAGKEIEQARAAQTALNEPLKAWHKRFLDLLPEYRQSPDLVLSRIWDADREKILAGITNEKYMVNTRLGHWVIQINTPPEMRKEIRTKTLESQMPKPPAGTPITPPAGPPGP